MTLVLRLPDELSRHLEAAAAERGLKPEDVAVEAIEAQLPARRRLAFVGMGHSGRSDLSEHVKELRREVADEQASGGV